MAAQVLSNVVTRRGRVRANVFWKTWWTLDRACDWIASTSGVLVLSGFALETIAFTTISDPRLEGVVLLPWLLALVCGVGGGCGLSILWHPVTPRLKLATGGALVAASLLRAAAHAWAILTDADDIVDGLARVAPVSIMIFPFVLGTILWKRAYAPEWPAEGR